MYIFLLTLDLSRKELKDGLIFYSLRFITPQGLFFNIIPSTLSLNYTFANGVFSSIKLLFLDKIIIKNKNFVIIFQ